MITSIKIANIEFKNPVFTASGTFGYGEDFAEFIDLNALGAIFTKGISLKPSDGNKSPRVVETSCGLINSIGLENIGIDAFLKNKLPFLQELKTPFFVNVYGEKEADYEKLAEIISEHNSISGIELNVSCPNVKKGGMAFGVDKTLLFNLVKKVRAKTKKCLIVKLSPNVTDIAPLAKASEEAGADAISLINTISAMAVDIKTKKPSLHNIIGGLSGPAIKPVALKMVWQASNAVRIPVIGVGGITNFQDAIEFFIVGASAIQVGTGNLTSPNTSIKIIKGIKKYLKKEKISDIKYLINSLEYW